MEPRKQLKQIIQIEHNIVKHPNWPKAYQLAIYKCGRGFELGAAVTQFQLVDRAGLEPETAGFRLQRTDHSATLSHYLPTSQSVTFSLRTSTVKCSVKPCEYLSTKGI